MKKIYSLLFLASAFTYAQQAPPFYEGFNYTSGQALQTQPLWTALNTGDDLLIASPSLSYVGLPASTGNKVTFAGSGIDAYKLIATQTTGTVYYSFLLNVNSMTGVTDANGGYFAGFAKDNTTFGGTLWTKRVDDTNFNIGIEVKTANAANTTYTTASFQTGVTYLIVVAYTFNAGTTSDDTVKLWVNPTLGGAEPAATLTDTHAGTDLVDIGRFFLRQDSPAETPDVQVDELRIATNWTDVTSTTVALKVNQTEISGLKVYPNPVVNGNLFITSDSNDSKEVAIFDILGKQVVKTTVTNQAVNVSNLKGGVYMVKITEEGKTATRKLIIR